MEYIESLRLFRAIVELKSFTRAADQLGLSRPSVSRAIALLEERMGARLLTRTTRQLSLTRSAERFYEGCVRILDELDALEADIAGEHREVSGVLRLVVHTSSALTRIGPLIAQFKRAHPKVILEVTLTERAIDLVADGYDLGIIIPYQLASETAIVRTLERIPMAMVAAPLYFKNRSLPTEPSQLADHQYVVMAPYLRRPVLTFEDENDGITIPLNYDIFSNSPILNHQMALEGLGICIVPIHLVESDLAAGRLVRLLEGYRMAEHAVEIRLAYVNRTLVPARLRAFIDFAVTYFEELPSRYS